MKPDPASPLRNGQGDPFVSDFDGAPRVIRLFNAGGPFAIIWAVAFRIIDALNRMELARTLSHVFDELKKW